MQEKHIPARPTIYRGIRMRSRLEAGFAQFLDSRGWLWEYEPVCFADETGQYLPDFGLVGASDGRLIYVEVKGVLPDPEPVKRRMEIIWSSTPDAELWLLGPDKAWYGLRARNPRWWS